LLCHIESINHINQKHSVQEFLQQQRVPSGLELKGNSERNCHDDDATIDEDEIFVEDQGFTSFGAHFLSLMKNKK
jgi:hypothetical protein